MLKFGLILVSSTVAFAQLPGSGECPNKKPIPNVDVEALMGTWYEYGRYAGITSLESKCNKEVFKLNKDGTIDFAVTSINTLTEGNVLIPGSAKLSSENGEGKFDAVYLTEPINIKKTILVLGTDYKNYCVSYSCHQQGDNLNIISASIFTRKPVPDKEVIDKAYNVVDLNGLNSELILKINQEGCDN